MNRFKNLLKSKKFIFITGLAVLTLLTFATYKFITAPRDLGPKLQYIGTVDTGCPWWFRVFFCDQRPGQDYYFATDMNLDEIKGYFKGAEIIEESKDGFAEYPTTFYTIEFLSGNRSFSINYYMDKANELGKKTLKQTSLKNIISISDYDYNVAKAITNTSD